MRVVAPTDLLLDAAEVLDPIRDDVVVIGAVAVHVGLDGHDGRSLRPATLTPELLSRTSPITDASGRPARPRWWR